MTPSVREFVLAIGSSLPASVVAKATVIAAFGLMGARLARRSRAAVRHVLLAATFIVLLLLPVASLIIPPVRVAVPTVRESRVVSSAPAVGGEEILPFTAPDAHPAKTSAASRSSGFLLFELVFMGWLAGATLILIPMFASLWKIHWLRRSGRSWVEGQKIVDGLSLESGFRRRVEVLLHEALPGPITSGMLHPAILLPLDAQTWSSQDLNRALVHELEHVRRGDIFTHYLARAVCAVYWFHPLVWMAWRQLILEAERSCDDAVILRSEPTAYADQLVALARRLVTSAKSPVLAMANRSDLAVRVHAMLDVRQRRGRVGRFVAPLACCTAAVLALTIAPVRTAAAPQSTSSPEARVGSSSATVERPGPSFEVTSIKPNKAGDLRTWVELQPGRFSASGITATRLIAFAYNVKVFQVSGGPGWVSSDRYDIEAKEPDSVAEELPKLSIEERSARLKSMLQSLLADRFALKVNHTTKEFPGYALVVAKDGPKLHAATHGDTYDNGMKTPDGRPVGRGGLALVGRGDLEGQGVPWNQFVFALSQELGRTVVDQTGLKGDYDVQLKWTPDSISSSPIAEPPPGGGAEPQPPPESTGPSIFTAVQEQLGLKLESTKVPTEVLAIDHIERPSAN
jgi:bla regulator protein blaR1